MKNSILAFSLALTMLLLCGCGETTVTVAGRQFPRDTTELTAIVTAEDLPSLEQLPNLRYADLSGSDCYAALLAWGEAHPGVTLRYTVPLPDGTLAENSASALDLSALRHEQVAAAGQALALLPAARSVDLGDTARNDLTPEDVAALKTAFPEILFAHTVLFDGQPLDFTMQSLDLSAFNDSELAVLIPWLRGMTALQRVELGDGGDAASPRVSWEHVRALRALCPDAHIQYRFTLYGQEQTLDATWLDFNHITMDDQGALVKAVTVCMPQLTWLDMDFCAVDDEHMAEIRDALPNAEVVWRIWFGDGYSVRTNVERIVASNPGKAGELTPENTQSLKYCTKVKYLDLGHNSYLSSIDFVRYMPELEVAILAMGAWHDCSPLSACTKLEYAELQTTCLNDLRPLAGLTNLRHLNICYNLALHDLTPLYDIPLERLWIGCTTPIPPEQVETYQALHPDCTIELESVDPTQTLWRYTGEDELGNLKLDPRYALLREQFAYDSAPDCYAYIENDPLYNPHS